MLNYETILFIIKYLAVLVLFIYTIKTKRTEMLYKAVVITFIAFSLMIIVNLLFSIFKSTESKTTFYQINGIDFLLIFLTLNLFLYKKGGISNKNKNDGDF